jgi:hypothetical protein
LSRNAKKTPTGAQKVGTTDGEEEEEDKETDNEADGMAEDGNGEGTEATPRQTAEMPVTKPEGTPLSDSPPKGGEDQ